MRRGSLGTRGALGCAVVGTLLSACGSRALSPDGSDAGRPASAGGAGGAGFTGSAGSSTGQAGGPGASTGAAGASTGAAGASTGAAGAASVPDPPLRISGSEALTRIAAVLWNQRPDGDLVSQAAGGLLTTTGGRESAVRQMLADPRATTGVGAFYKWWLNLGSVVALKKDPTLFPAFTPALQASMADETATYGIKVTLDLHGSFQTLMTSSFSFINAGLADIYGVPGVTGDALRLVNLPAGERAGLLTQPALQALGSFPTRNSPPRRGANVERVFFCQTIPSAPAEAPGLAPPPAGTTVREAVEEYRAAAICAACHGVLDGPGFAFEGFDAIGRTRATDNGAPVDTAAALPSGATFTGAVDLAHLLANDVSAQDCFAQRWLSFALGRPVGDDDQVALHRIDAAFQSSGDDLEALIVAVLSSDIFLSP